ncbi:Uncharacterised protein [Salmonella enterica subsp. arizonae]|uniref:Outer membrane protein n=1 Tax=Salmonella enterica subsp. arizonae TaxID=59203 RepID=A0A2X4T5G8_SALER|nr:Uncharacterised protein [Salmonella enterica subsp. arizonae]
MKLTLKSLATLTLLATSASHAAVIYQANDGSNIDLYGRLGFNISDKKQAIPQETLMPVSVFLPARLSMTSWRSLVLPNIRSMPLNMPTTSARKIPMISPPATSGQGSIFQNTVS